MALGSSQVYKMMSVYGPISVVKLPYLGESTVVPEVTLVREAVANVAEFALLDVLLDGVEGLLLGDLKYGQPKSSRWGSLVELKREREIRHIAARGPRDAQHIDQ
jgi:hypothetical protein